MYYTLLGGVCQAVSVIFLCKVKQGANPTEDQSDKAQEAHEGSTQDDDVFQRFHGYIIPCSEVFVKLGGGNI